MPPGRTSRLRTHLTSLVHAGRSTPPHLSRPLFIFVAIAFLTLRSRTIALPYTVIASLFRFLSSIPSLLGISVTNGRGRRHTKVEEEEDMARILQQVYVEKEDGTKELLVPYRGRVVRIPIRERGEEVFTEARERGWFGRAGESREEEKSRTKKGLTPTFIHQLLALLHISMPLTSSRSNVNNSITPSRELLLLSTHTMFLLLRTLLSILVAKLDGQIVRDIVRADAKGFMRGLGMWFVLAVPSSVTNSMIRHIQSLLSLRLRTNLTRYLHDLYLSKHPYLRYYRVQQGQNQTTQAQAQSQSNARLEGIDQYLTADVEAWSGALSGLYGNTLKPTLDLVLFTSQLSLSLGLRGTLLLFVNYWCTVRVLRYATPSGRSVNDKRPSFAVLAGREMQLEGEYRNAVGRIGREAEEVAFYDGGIREREVLVGRRRRTEGKEGKEGVWEKLRRHLERTSRIRITYEWTEDYVIKYLWSAAGYALIAVPILYTRKKRIHHNSSAGPSGSATGNAVRAAAVGVAAGVASVVTANAGAAGALGGRDEQIAGRTETYISSRRLLLNLADAGGRLMYAYKDVLELAGLTGRLYELVKVLVWIEGPSTGDAEHEGEKVQLDEECIKLVDVDVRVPGTYRPNVPLVSTGKIQVEETISQIEPQVESSGQLASAPLVSKLNLSIGLGQHTMITGSNGVGKTAVARVLGGLWDVGSTEGFLHMPKDSSEVESFLSAPMSSTSTIVPSTSRLRPRPRPRPTLYVVPQRSYMPVGSLLEQIIYPCSYAQFIKLTSPSNRSLPTRSKSFLSRSLERLPSLPSLPSMPSLTRGRSSTLMKTLEDTPLPSPSALAEIHAILESVHLGYLVEREGGLYVRKEWRDVLSGGEKQRMGMARVLWWRPRWAVLDECTSAVSSDVEGRMYEAAKGMGITLITISLRPSLAKYHTQLLTLHGPSASGQEPGSWTLSVIGTPEERLSLTNEIRSLEEKLSEVDGWERRVKELEAMLSVQEGVFEDDEAVDAPRKDNGDESDDDELASSVGRSVEVVGDDEI